MEKTIEIHNAVSNKVYVIGGTESAFSRVVKKGEQEQVQIITDKRHKRKSAFRCIRHLFKCEVSPCTCLFCCSG